MDTSRTAGRRADRPIAITLGDPCGIGPEIVLKAFAAGLPAPCVVVGDIGLLRRESERLRLGLAIEPVASPAALAARASTDGSPSAFARPSRASSPVGPSRTGGWTWRRPRPWQT